MDKRPSKQKKKIKALVMFSGGLDSSLVLRILEEEGVRVEAVHFKGVFHKAKFDEYDSYVKDITDKFGIKLTSLKIEDDFIDILKNPRYGYGSNMNPCIDCRIYVLKKAKAYMKDAGASFIATGEVLGQRPMSQRKNSLDVVEKRSELIGLLLRPLSAKLLKPTIPEEKGWVRRENLFAISGRSRKEQMALAKKYGIKDYPNPAGGCLLTDPQFSIKAKDLLKYDALTMKEMELLKVGRHFRLSSNTKAIVGRNQDDNTRILKLAGENDILLRLGDMPGPVTLLRGKHSTLNIEKAGSLTARYSKAGEGDLVKISQYIADADGRKKPFYKKGEKETSFLVKPAGDDVTTKYMI